MDFEKIKAAWLAQDFEGYLFDTPLSEIAADIERKAERMDGMNKREDRKRITGCIAIYIAAGLLYSASLGLIGNIGVTLFLIGTTLELISYLKFHFKFRDVRYELPMRDFLVEERKRVLARINVLKLNTSWNLIPIVLGLLLYGYPKMYHGYGLIILVLVLFFAIGVTIWQGRRRIRKYLTPYLAEVDEEIAEIDALPT
jgi:hypothetical protein